MQRDGWLCQLCGEAFESPAPAPPHPMSVTVDHVIPVWSGGGEPLENLRLAHRVCNMRRQKDHLSPKQVTVREAAFVRLASASLAPGRAGGTRETGSDRGVGRTVTSEQAALTRTTPPKT